MHPKLRSYLSRLIFSSQSCQANINSFSAKKTKKLKNFISCKIHYYQTRYIFKVCNSMPEKSFVVKRHNFIQSLYISLIWQVTSRQTTNFSKINFFFTLSHLANWGGNIRLSDCVSTDLFWGAFQNSRHPMLLGKFPSIFKSTVDADLIR